MSDHKDGGPAFPLATNWPCDSMEQGMTLRDYFAAHAESFDSDDSPQWIASQLGWLAPESTDMGGRDGLLWRCRADATYKYMQADAMIEAGEKQT